MRQRAYTIILAALAILCPAAPAARQEPAKDEIQRLLDEGAALLQQGKPKEAIDPLERARAKAEKVLGKDHERTALALIRLGRGYRELGQYAKAEPLFQRGLEIREGCLGKDHVDVAHVLYDLAELHRSTGKYAKAEPFYKRSVAIFEAQPDKDNTNVALALSGLALLYLDLAKFARAEPLCRRSLAIYEARLSKDHPYVASALTNLADLYQDMGQHGRAEPLYLRSLAIYEAKLSKDHPRVAFALNNLAVLYERMKQYDKAEPHSLRSLAIWEAKLGKNHPEVAKSLNNLALLYRNLGQHTRAEPLFRRSLAIYEAQTKGHLDVALTLYNLAQLYGDTREYAKAEPLFQRGLAIWEARLGKDHPLVATSLHSQAWHLEAQGRTNEAALLFNRARQSSRRHVSLVLPFLPPAEQAAYLAFRDRRQFAMALSLPLQHSHDSSLAECSATWLLNGKAVAEEALARSALLARDSGDTAVGQLAARLREIRADLAHLAITNPPEGQEKTHKQRLTWLVGHEQQLSRNLAAAGGAALAASTWLDLTTLRQRLPADGVLIDVARIEVFDFQTPPNKTIQPARYVAWVTPAKGDVRVIDLGDAAAIDAAVQGVRRALDGAVKLIRANGDLKAENALREPLRELSKLVLKPLLPHIGKATRWIVSPDGNLWLIPWEILLLSDDKYVLENHTLSYVVSGRDLVLRSAYKGKLSQPVVVADPNFSLSADAARVVTRQLLLRGDDEDEVRGLADQLPLGSIQRLPGTRVEARAIEKPLAAYTRRVPALYLGKYAVEGAVKAEKNPSVLVLATHGFFLPAERVKSAKRPGGEAAPGWSNPLLRCGLLLAGCNDAARAEDGDDGVLTGLEVVGMDLRGCEIVVLSACETGIGDVQNGEGVAGLRQAFRLAGAESVVSTLWQVSDSSTAQLMTLFFANLAKGKDRASALRSAQLTIIEQRREDRASAHPFFWAAFTLTGR